MSLNNMIYKIKEFDNVKNNLQDEVNKVKEDFFSRLNKKDQIINNLLDEIKKVKLEINSFDYEEIISDMKKLNGDYDEMDVGFEVVDSVIKDLSSFMEEVSSAMIESSAALIQITNSINEINDRVQELKEDSKGGIKNINSTDQHIKNVEININSISELIFGVLDTNSKINNLAINAAIESAHAGEYGKGFAVIAETIRNISGESNIQVKRIPEILKKINISIDDSIEISKDTVEKFQNISEKINIVSSEIFSINSATQESSASVNQVMKSTTEALSIIENLKENFDMFIETGIEKKDKYINFSEKSINIFKENSIILNNIKNKIDCIGA